jgi:hypothetical protein
MFTLLALTTYASSGESAFPVRNEVSRVMLIGVPFCSRWESAHAGQQKSLVRPSTIATVRE